MRRLHRGQDRTVLEPSYQRARFADLHALLRAVPRERIAVQCALADRLARCLEQSGYATSAGTGS